MQVEERMAGVSSGNGFKIKDKGKYVSSPYFIYLGVLLCLYRD